MVEGRDRDDALLDGAQGGFGAGGRVQAAEDIADVFARGIGADAQAGGDSLVRLAGGDEAEDGELADGEAGRIGGGRVGGVASGAVVGCGAGDDEDLSSSRMVAWTR